MKKKLSKTLTILVLRVPLNFPFKIVHPFISDKYRIEICLPQLPADNDVMLGCLLQSSHVNPIFTPD